ncbi:MULTISPECIES: cupin domain-containing protein [unclassified Streptomyces]|uniref:cupin domain-containing protein n=1 Tax=unclassified Streptomyces TaxID=2593676 RepID=UPI0033A7F8F4
MTDTVSPAAPSADTERAVRVVSIDEVPANTRRGGDIRTLLSPGTVGATTGFLGVAILQEGESIAEHYHPYSEEFVFAVRGELELDLDDVPHRLTEGQGLVVPKNMRHRVRNTGSGEARIVFHLCPLAPRPELGHVDTEEARPRRTADTAEKGRS